MDNRLKKLEDIQKKQEEIEIAKISGQLLAEGGTDSDPAVVQLENNGNVSRQLYDAVGHKTLQSTDDGQSAKLIESAKPSMPFHNNQSQFLRKEIND